MPGAAKKAPAKKSAARPSPPKKAGSKKAGAKKAAKPVAKRPPAKQAAAKQAAAKPVAKRPPAKKVPAKKAAAKKAPAKKAPVTKAAAKPVAKRPPVKKVPAKKAPAKKAPPKKKTVICELSGFEVMPGPAQLSPKTLDRLRQKLMEERVRLEHQAQDLAAEAETLAREREAGDTQFDEESGEGDTVNIERERDLLLSASASSVVEDINEALARMKKGTYGVCKYAGRKIPLERLEAIPWANVCVDCKARAERRR